VVKIICVLNNYGKMIITDTNSLYICTMRKALKISVAVALSVLYGLAVFHIYGMLAIQINHSAYFQKNRVETVIVTAADIHDSFALPSKISIASEAGGPITVSFSQLHKYPAAVLKDDSHHLVGSCSKYVREWLNNSIGLSISDIIFPFHYFW
jgi:hypothetical protein